MIRRFQRNYPETQVDLVEGYFETFSSDEKFDVINMGFVLEHVDDPIGLLNRVKNWLAPGGRLFLGVPNGNSEISAPCAAMSCAKDRCRAG